MGCCGSQTTGINIEDIFNKKNQYIDDNNSINESNENNNKKNINKKNEINLQQKKKMKISQIIIFKIMFQVIIQKMIQIKNGKNYHQLEMKQIM